MVADLFGTIATATAVYATNVDDVLILAVLFLSSRAGGRPRPWQIITGMYAGTGVLVGVSAVAAVGLLLVPDTWVGLLGLAPLALGVRGLFKAARAKPGDDRSPVVASGTISITVLIVANGGDNLAVYPPLFRTLGVADSLVTAAVFAVLVGVWCAIGALLTSHKRLIGVVEQFGHWLVPSIFVLLGAAIILESGITGVSLDLL